MKYYYEHSSCNAFSCMNSCQMGKALDQIPVNYDEKDGFAEFACGLASHYMSSSYTSCKPGTPTQRMGIVIANSDMHFANTKWTQQCTNDFVYVTVIFIYLFQNIYSNSKPKNNYSKIAAQDLDLGLMFVQNMIVILKIFQIMDFIR